jgi:hypothetical protein
MFLQPTRSECTGLTALGILNKWFTMVMLVTTKKTQNCDSKIVSWVESNVNFTAKMNPICQEFLSVVRFFSDIAKTDKKIN